MPMDPKIYQQLLETFKDELQEQYEAMVVELLKLEKINKSELQNCLQNLFRSSHNIKGAAKSVSLDVVATIAHRLEDLFNKWRDKKHKPNKSQIKACLTVADNMIAAYQAQRRDEAIDLEAYLAPLSGKQQNTKIKKSEPVSESSLKIPLHKIENVNAKVDEFITYQLKLEGWIKSINDYIKSMKELQSKKFDLNQLEQAIRKVENLYENGNQFYGDFSRSLNTLQDNLRAMRLIPIATIIPSLQRSVHDISASLNKNIELIVEGSDIELDKPILDAIRDPLQHLIRNAIDHAIEDVETRIKLNKPEKSTIKILISNDSGKIKIEFIDDGRGIDIKKIKQKAIETSLLPKDKLDNMSNNELLNIIFYSGFSTQKQVSEISGRGVGLDIVRANIEKVKGNVSLRTKINKGTIFTINLPLTLATTRGLFINIEDQIFMLNTFAVMEIFEINPRDLKLVNNEVIYVVHDKPVSTKILAHILGFNNFKLNEKEPIEGILIEQSGQKVVLLMQNSIEDEHDCVVKPLPSPLNQVKLLLGVAITGAGNLALVLSARELLTEAYNYKTYQSQKYIEPTLEIQNKIILVVDDSLTTRNLTANSLEASGFKVETAINGEDAWRLLQTQKFDCIVTDIEMPKMNGFELTKHVKANKEFANIPVIIVTAHEHPEEMHRGLELGADSYLTKSQFDTRKLIETIKSLL